MRLLGKAAFACRTYTSSKYGTRLDFFVAALLLHIDVVGFRAVCTN